MSGAETVLEHPQMMSKVQDLLQELAERRATEKHLRFELDSLRAVTVKSANRNQDPYLDQGYRQGGYISALGGSMEVMSTMSHT